MSRVITPQGYWNVKQIAEYLQCTPQAVYKLHHTKGLPLILRIGSEKGYIASIEAVEKWVKSVYSPVS